MARGARRRVRSVNAARGSRAGSLVLLCCVACFGCARGFVADARVSQLRRELERVREKGGRQCAPREMALADAHLAFARAELRQGDADRAVDHLVIARPNLALADALSAAKTCRHLEGGVGEGRDGDRDGLPVPADRCPREPEDWDGYQDADGCPDDQDSDGDGVSDSRDMCPVEAEDGDAYLEHDGCPEPDNDLDGLADAEDRCPLDAEDPDGFRDEDGCPDTDNDEDGVADAVDQCPFRAGVEVSLGCAQVYKYVRMRDTVVSLKKPIRFFDKSAKLRPGSRDVLDSVAAVLRDYPKITLDIQVHTDSRGEDAANQTLSEQRAQAVRSELVRRGVEPSRLTTTGYGETRPIESNRTSRGRAANRRVELVRTDTKAGSASP